MRIATDKAEKVRPLCRRWCASIRLRVSAELLGSIRASYRSLATKPIPACALEYATVHNDWPIAETHGERFVWVRSDDRLI
jgi:hypothetical protein